MTTPGGGFDVDPGDQHQAGSGTGGLPPDILGLYPQVGNGLGDVLGDGIRREIDRPTSGPNSAAPADGGNLNVNSGDLTDAGKNYDDLSKQIQDIYPQLGDEIRRALESHGPMGFPAILGMTAGLAAHEGSVQSRAAAFADYSQRFRDHAATYLDEDAAGAGRITEF